MCDCDIPQKLAYYDAGIWKRLYPPDLKLACKEPDLAPVDVSQALLLFRCPKIREIINLNQGQSAGMFDTSRHPQEVLKLLVCAIMQDDSADQQKKKNKDKKQDKQDLKDGVLNESPAESTTVSVCKIHAALIRELGEVASAYGCENLSHWVQTQLWREIVGGTVESVHALSTWSASLNFDMLSDACDAWGLQHLPEVLEHFLRQKENRWPARIWKLARHDKKGFMRQILQLFSVPALVRDRSVPREMQQQQREPLALRDLWEPDAAYRLGGPRRVAARMEAARRVAERIGAREIFGRQMLPPGAAESEEEEEAPQMPQMPDADVVPAPVP